MTTVSPPGGSASELYRGFASIPLGVLALICSSDGSSQTLFSNTTTGYEYKAS